MTRVCGGDQERWWRGMFGQTAGQETDRWAAVRASNTEGDTAGGARWLGASRAAAVSTTSSSPPWRAPGTATTTTAGTATVVTARPHCTGKSANIPDSYV